MTQNTTGNVTACPDAMSAPEAHIHETALHASAVSSLRPSIHSGADRF
ncbi:MAG: hypothetical protein ACRD15_02030 [Vicinamibacterales bacterium]